MVNRAHASKKVKKTDPVFAQANPPDRCRNPRFLLRQALHRSQRTGKEYISKCRCASCSIQCNRNHASKICTCVDRRFEELPGHYLSFGGNLQMAKGSTPEDHARVKRAFLQNLRRAKEKRDAVIEIFAQRHSTTIHACHWDISVYTDQPKTVAKSIICDCWTRAGGSHKAVKLISREQMANWVKYAGKDHAKVEANEVKNMRFIPAHSSICRLDSTWATRGFWGGRKLEDYWQDFLDTLFPDRVLKREQKAAEIDTGSNNSITILASNQAQIFDPANAVLPPEINDFCELEDLGNQPVLTAFQKEILKQFQALERDPDRDLSSLRQTLSDSPEGAEGADRIASRFNWDIDYTMRLLSRLESQGRAVRTKGDLVGGNLAFNTWYRSIPAN